MSDISPVNLNPYLITTPPETHSDIRPPARLRGCLLALALAMHAVQGLVAAGLYYAFVQFNRGHDPTVLLHFVSGPMLYGALIVSAAVGLLAVAAFIARRGLRPVADADLPWLLSGLIHLIVLAVGVYVII